MIGALSLNSELWEMCLPDRIEYTLEYNNTVPHLSTFIIFFNNI